MHSRVVRWEGFFNARDLGGLPTRDGGRTSTGAFIRSAELRFVTEAGWRQAGDAGVSAVVDLRNPAEICSGGQAPGPPPGLTGAGEARLSWAAVPLDDADIVDFIRHERLNGTPLYYQHFLDRKADRCAAVIAALARTGPGAVIFHCTAGRDRTGLVALLLLAIADVEPDAIVADYQMSADHVRELQAAMGIQARRDIPAELAARGTSVPEVIHRLLDRLDPRDYLLRAGVSVAELAAIKARLTG